METLDVWSRDGMCVFKYVFDSGCWYSLHLFSFLPPDSVQVLQVADALCAQLSSQDLIGNIANRERQEKNVVPSRQMSANPLLISC